MTFRSCSDQRILLSFSRDTENIARAAVDEELDSILRGSIAAYSTHSITSPVDLAE